jgi:hypothetical protein
MSKKDNLIYLLKDSGKAYALMKGLWRRVYIIGRTIRETEDQSHKWGDLGYYIRDHKEFPLLLGKQEPKLLVMHQKLNWLRKESAKALELANETCNMYTSETDDVYWVDTAMNDASTEVSAEFKAKAEAKKEAERLAKMALEPVIDPNGGWDL